MPRSAGITGSAVVVIISSIFAILGAAMMELGSLFLSRSTPAPNVPANLGFFIGVEALLVFGFGGWGLAAGIGLLRLKQWARISTLVFATLLVFVSVPIAALMAFVPLPNSNDPNLPSNFMSMMRIAITFFYVAVAALGGFWLYFFNTQSVKEQFQAGHAAVGLAAQHSPLATQISTPSATRPVRPLSITIIGWFLLIGSAFAPLGLLFNSAFFPGVQLPLYFLGFFFFGRSASLILIVWMATQMVAAVGLLRLKNWGLFAAIGLQCLAVANGALLVGIPANRARFQQIMETMTAAMNARMPQPVPFVFPIWIGFAMSFPIMFVILWLLITRKKSFAAAAQELARQRS